MKITIKTLLLGFLSLSYLFCLPGKATDKLYHQRESVEIESSKKIKSTGESMREDFDGWLNKMEINVHEKKFILDVSKKIKEEIKHNLSMQHAFIDIIKAIQEKESIDDRVIGFNIVSFNGKIYSKPFLGWNAK